MEILRGIMQRMSISKILAVITSFLIVCVVTVLIIKDFETPKPNNWDEGVTLKTNAFLGRHSVVETNTEARLFQFSVDPRFFPASVKKIDENKWIVEFERIR